MNWLKLTWTSRDQTTQNQIDHMTISRRWRRTCGRCKGLQRNRCRLRPWVGKSEPEGATSKGTSNRTPTDKAFWHFHTLITRPTPWVLHCPSKQIPNTNRPRRALYRCQVGTDQYIIPCNMRGENRIQKKSLCSGRDEED